MYSLCQRLSHSLPLNACHRLKAHKLLRCLHISAKHSDETKSGQKLTNNTINNNDNNYSNNTNKAIDYNKVFTFPNILCMTRIAFTPVIAYLVIDEHFAIALSLCAIGSVTDLLDGYIARKYNCVTKLGAILDPMADKLLVATLTICLTVVQLIPFWLTALILTRDALIIAGALYLMNRTLRPPKTWRRFIQMSTVMSSRFRPTLISKVNTGFQLSLVAITLAAPVFGYNHHWVLTGLQLATGVTTLSSGLNYLKRLKPGQQL